MGNSPRHRIVLLKVSCQEKHRRRTKNIRRKIHGLYPNIVIVNFDGKLDVGFLEEVIHLLPLLNCHLAVISTRLVIVAIGPEDADTDRILL